MSSHKISVKSIIINNKNEILLIKRKDNDVHFPGAWEFPGGRLNDGESPFEGLKRETKEETNLDIDIQNPLRVAYFVRDDGQIITAIDFLCKPKTYDVKLSNEHVDFTWINVKMCFDKLDKVYHEDIKTYIKYFS
jgi:8-oxo-dGTP pyrophosphatase MutT (NUDIX family)